MALSSPTPDKDSERSSGIALPNLERLVRARLKRHLRDARAEPALTIVGYRQNRADVLLRSGDQPEEQLLGFSLPDRFEAIGVFASSVVAQRPQGHHREATVAVALTRSGQILTRVATSDGRVIAASNPQGWVVDACLRALDRPTAPAPYPSIEFPLALWLDRLMVTILDSKVDSPLPWSDAVDLCPVPTESRSLDPTNLGTALGSTLPSWSTMRQSTADGAHGPLPIRRAWARWMDDGMFARWCLGYFPDISNLRSDVEFLAPPAVAERVEVTVKAARLAAGE